MHLSLFCRWFNPVLLHMLKTPRPLGVKYKKGQRSRWKGLVPNSSVSGPTNTPLFYKALKIVANFLLFLLFLLIFLLFCIYNAGLVSAQKTQNKKLTTVKNRWNKNMLMIQVQMSFTSVWPGCVSVDSHWNINKPKWQKLIFWNILRQTFFSWKSSSFVCECVISARVWLDEGEADGVMMKISSEVRGRVLVHSLDLIPEQHKHSLITSFGTMERFHTKHVRIIFHHKNK